MSYYAEESYAVYEEIQRKANREHRCDACGAVISKRERYTSVHIVYDGASTVKRCARCQAMHLHLRELCLARGDMWPHEKLGCGLDYEEEWEQEPPPYIQELPFATPDRAALILRYVQAQAKVKGLHKVESSYRKWYGSLGIKHETALLIHNHMSQCAEQELEALKKELQK